ncbi:multidrug efflux MATE transporter FepA [Ravibacter arvi]|uniref:Multidrug efflux MATE transporter FepA n=2 Tax=Ravibacter arvi TaxID=2051041 RepID=A0ABP8M4T8_9BACT
MLSSTVHQVINGIVLGPQVGKEGLAAVGLFGPVVVVLVAFALPIMIGGGVLIGKSLGAGDYEKVQQVFQFATTLVLVIGGSIAVTVPLSAGVLARFLAGADHAVLVDYTSDYAFWQLVSLPLFFLNMVWGNFVRADNAPKAARNASVLAAAVNIMLDLFLVVWLGLGVEGASIATALAFLSGSAYLFVYILKGKTHYRFSSFRFTLRLSQWRELTKTGMPSFASEIAFSSGLLLINQRLTRYGAVPIAAFGLINYASFILIRPFTAAMIASLPVISYNIGAGRPDRVLAMLRFSLTFTFVLGGFMALLGVLLPGYLVSLFSEHKSDTYRQVLSQGFGLYFLLFLAAGPNYILGAYLQSTGKTTLSILINLMKGFLLVVAGLAILPDLAGLPGVWLSRSLAEILTLLLIGLYMLYHKRKFFGERAIRPV